MEMKVDRSKARLLRMSESDDSGFVEGTPSERIAMVWPLTYEVFSLSKYHDVERRLQRHVVRVTRRER